tara:strand:+ start:2003 stop:2419 length:417 start_codon:yes stop_codon:yes gene_type:complete
MKKTELKQLIKPLVKECIHEVLIEEGLLSNVVAEVAKGMQGNLVVEKTHKKKERLFTEDLQMKRKTAETKVKMEEHRKKIMKSMGKSAYNGVDLFEGTEPMRSSDSQQTHADLGNPTDSGVDISSLVGGASKIWQAIK